MKIKKIALILILFLISLLGVYFCAFRYPNLIKNDDALKYWIILSLHWLASLACFVVVGIFAYLSYLFVRNKLFSLKSVKLIKVCSLIILFDTFFFLALFITSLSLSLLTEFYTHIAILVFGIVMTLSLRLFANHIAKVTKDQDELEGIV